MLAREDEMARSEIDARHDRAGKGVLTKVNPLPTADIKNMLTDGTAVIENSGYPRPVSAPSSEQITSAAYVWATGIGGPLLYRSFLPVNSDGLNASTLLRPCHG